MGTGISISLDDVSSVLNKYKDIRVRSSKYSIFCYDKEYSIADTTVKKIIEQKTETEDEFKTTSVTHTDLFGFIPLTDTQIQEVIPGVSKIERLYYGERNDSIQLIENEFMHKIKTYLRSNELTSKCNVRHMLYHGGNLIKLNTIENLSEGQNLTVRPCAILFLKKDEIQVSYKWVPIESKKLP